MSLLEESCRQSKAFEDVVKQFEVSSDMKILGIFIVCLRINLNLMAPLSQFISVHLLVEKTWWDDVMPNLFVIKLFIKYIYIYIYLFETRNYYFICFLFLQNVLCKLSITLSTCFRH